MVINITIYIAVDNNICGIFLDNCKQFQSLSFRL